MSISTALHSAMSGLAAAGRASALVSDNIANALNPGYARRSLVLGSNARTGSGVQVLGIVRHADPGVIANRRAADAEHAATGALAGFHARFADLVGDPSDPGSIGARLADFQTALIEAASRPDSATRLTAVTNSAGDLAGAISGAAEGLRGLRTTADRSIGAQVERLNSALAQVQKLNVQITAAQSTKADTASLQDQRQVLVDEINAMVPVKVAARDHGQIALYSEAGAILLDGPAARLNFSVATETMPHMTVDNGLLSGLQINGMPVRTDSATGALTGGTLAAQFQIRDELAVSAQADLDALARDLVERFAEPGLDPTALPGAPGLFTDRGTAFDPVDEIGLALRLQLNSLVDPAQAGDSWKLRDGLGAASPGDPGDARLLRAFAAAMTQTRATGSGRFGTGSMTAAGVSDALLSRSAQASSLADRSLSLAAASRTELTRIELAQGVDTDAELQALLLIEQAYAANARVIETVDDMMQTLLRL